MISSNAMSKPIKEKAKKNHYLLNATKSKTKQVTKNPTILHICHVPHKKKKPFLYLFIVSKSTSQKDTVTVADEIINIIYQ